MLKNALSALHLQKRLIYFNQTCTDISLGNAKRVDKILMTLAPFSGHRRSKKVENTFVCTLSAHIYILEVQKNL